LRLRFKPTRLVEVVEDAMMALSQQLEEKRISVENRIDPETPPVLIDRSRIMEVLINLIGNGIKFTPSGGKVTIDSRGLTEERNYLKIVVTDTGVGITSEDLPKIFDRFYQGQRTQEGAVKGTGLGLAISKEIIDGHQGSLHAESREGGGTSMLFTLPLFGVNAIFDLMIHPMLEEAERDAIPLSVIQVDFWNQQTKRETVFSGEAWETLVCAVQKMVRTVDTIVPFQNNKVFILTFNKKLVRK
jgi:anti-sigma regulatory factor (Ser/Thr protein kinase)